VQRVWYRVKIEGVHYVGVFVLGFICFTVCKDEWIYIVIT